MTTATVQAPKETTWSSTAAPVRKALAFVRKQKEGVTADELVAWDFEHGRRLFDWDDASASAEWRKHQARNFLNHFTATFNQMKVRGFLHVEEDEAANIERSAYFTIEAIAAHPGMRAQVIADITRRMEGQAAQLQMWQLSEPEQQALFAQLREAIANGRIRRHAA